MSRACLWKTHRATTPDRAEIGRICGVSFPLQASGSADSVQGEANAVSQPLSETGWLPDHTLAIEGAA